MLPVQEYLLTHSLEQLRAAHAVVASNWTHGKVSLNYHQLDSRRGDPVADVCRGLILARPDRTLPAPDAVFGPSVVVARAFDRFYDDGDGIAAPVDFATARFYTKLDGSLILVYHDPGLDAWHVATRGVPEGDATVGQTSQTFRGLVEEALRLAGLTFAEFTAQLDPRKTWLFEVVAPANRVFVRYGAPALYLLGVRDPATGQESDPEDVRLRGAPTLMFRADHAPGPPAAHDKQHLVAATRDANPLALEGFVAVDAQFRRVKMKTTGWNALALARDSTAPARGLLALVLIGHAATVRDVVAPRLVATLDRFVAALTDIAARHDAACATLAAEAATTPNPRKHVALKAQSLGLMMGPVMSRFVGQSTSFRDWLEQQRAADGGWPRATLDAVITHMRAPDVATTSGRAAEGVRP